MFNKMPSSTVAGSVCFGVVVGCAPEEYAFLWSASCDDVFLTRNRLATRPQQIPRSGYFEEENAIFRLGQWYRFYPEFIPAEERKNEVAWRADEAVLLSEEEEKQQVLPPAAKVVDGDGILELTGVVVVGAVWTQESFTVYWNPAVGRLYSCRGDVSPPSSLPLICK